MPEMPEPITAMRMLRAAFTPECPAQERYSTLGAEWNRRQANAPLDALARSLANRRRHGLQVPDQPDEGHELQ